MIWLRPPASQNKFAIFKTRANCKPFAIFARRGILCKVLHETEYYRELGQRVQRARIASALTQESLASLVGLTRTSIVNIEKGRQKVLAHTLVRLSRSLNVAIDELA